MFEIEYKGANCIVITTKKSKLITDPKLSVVGLKDLSTKNAVELLTEKRFATKEDQDTILSIDGPGEYGVAGFDIHGVSAQRHLDRPDEPQLSTMYRVEIGDSRIGIVGNVYEKLSDEQLESLGVLDVLVIPIGGNGYTLDAIGAAGLARQIGPKVVIPVHYDDKSLNYEVPQNGLDLFTKELGSPVETMAKYKYKQPSSDQPSLSIIEITRS